MTSKLDAALLTVEQAKTKWCPEARALGLYGDMQEGQTPPAVNREANGVADSGATCLGDRCMYWRWHDRKERSQPHIVVAPAPLVHAGNGVMGRTPRPDDGGPWELDEEESIWFVPAPDLPARGYCGKAGHPHAALMHRRQMELIDAQLYAIQD